MNSSLAYALMINKHAELLMKILTLLFLLLINTLKLPDTCGVNSLHHGDFLFSRMPSTWTVNKISLRFKKPSATVNVIDTLQSFRQTLYSLIRPLSSWGNKCFYQGLHLLCSWVWAMMNEWVECLSSDNIVHIAYLSRNKFPLRNYLPTISILIED